MLKLEGLLESFAGALLLIWREKRPWVCWLLSSLEGILDVDFLGWFFFEEGPTMISFNLALKTGSCFIFSNALPNLTIASIELASRILDGLS